MVNPIPPDMYCHTSLGNTGIGIPYYTAYHGSLVGSQYFVMLMYIDVVFMGARINFHYLFVIRRHSCVSYNSLTGSICGGLELG